MKAERYTIQYSADQLLLQPECPVHVKKLQCTRDNLTGSLLLQIRYVNRSERTVEGLVIRVQIRDSAGQVLTDLRALPVGGLCAAPHHCFGDEKTVILPRAPGDLRVLVEQVQFSDGYLWRSKPEAPLLRVCEPVRICGRVQPSQHGDYWYCACGLVNPAKAPVCGYCGKRSPFGAAAPSAAVSVPAAAPRPAQAVPAASAPPVFVPDCYVFPTPSADTAGYLPQSPLNAAAPVPAAAPAQEFPVIEPRKEEPEKKSHKALWITLLVVLVLACVAAVYFFGYPLYQYRRAMDAQAAGNYAQAASLYESLGDYDDAATRLSECRYLQAQGLAEDGDYAGALKLYEALGDYSDSAAQAEACKLQQAQGLFDDGNYKRAYKALADVAESEERDELLSQCLQQLCKQALDSEDADTARVYLEEEKSMSLTPVPAWIDEAERHCTYLDARKAYAAGSYDEAEEGFRSSSYDDYADWINACEYAKAKALADQKEYTQAAAAFEALGGYQDSKAQKDGAMYAYVKDNYNTTDATTQTYLAELIKDDWEDAQKLYDELYVWQIKVVLNSSQQDAGTDASSLKDVSELVFHYTVTGGHLNDSTLTLAVEYTLPSGTTGTLTLAEGLKKGDTGSVAWTKLSSVKESKAGKLKLVIRDAKTKDVLFEKEISIGS